MDSIHTQQLDTDAVLEKCVVDAWVTRKQSDSPSWRNWVEQIRAGETFHFLHRDPFTRHAFTKPRGYPGDAALLDYIYRMWSEVAAQHAPDPVGNEIMRFTVNSPAPRAVRYRREYLARLIDESAEQHPGARVLSIAAGHLREVELSAAVASGNVSEIVAFDQDAESLAVIARDYAHLPIRTEQGSVRHLLAGKVGLGKFHLVYAAGLFDYLDDSVATRLVERMWAMTLPGGRMMIANFLPDIPDAGYMEAFMDWWLIYRDEARVQELFAGIPAAEISEMKVEFDPGRNICFLVAVRTNTSH